MALKHYQKLTMHHFSTKSRSKNQKIISLASKRGPIDQISAHSKSVIFSEPELKTKSSFVALKIFA